jgi:23S rRNA (pseudouridine1915-N3)-methyltransferase
MQKVTLLCVGKLKEPFYAAAVAEYQKRLTRHCKLEIVELTEQKLPDNPSPAEIAQALEKEAAAITERLPKGGAVIAMCIEGKTMSSEALAQKVEGFALGGASTLTFLIGGSFGLHESVKQRADLRLSMSPMTFPHHLAWVMLLEQLYRAYQILEGSKYHK